jgi:RNA polymerase-associated protein LEO1
LDSLFLEYFSAYYLCHRGFIYAPFAPILSRFVFRLYQLLTFSTFTSNLSLSKTSGGQGKNAMASNKDGEQAATAAANKNAALFGDDSSSDDESVGGSGAASAVKKNIREDTKMADGDGSSVDDEFKDDGIVGTSNAGSAKAVGSASTAAPPVIKTMNQTLGLESDSDDNYNDHTYGGSGGGANGEEKAKNKDGVLDIENAKSAAVYVPPRKMELLDLQPNSNKIVYHTVKLPNLVGINTTPYNSKTHNTKSEEEYFRGYVHNMIRWRYKVDEETGELLRGGSDDNHDDDSLVRESNTRLVKWSDGSYTLHVGQEVLEVDNLDSSVPIIEGGGGGNKVGVLPGFAGINGYLYASQKARIRPPTKKELEGPNKGDFRDYDEASDGENKKDKVDDDDVPPPTQSGGTVLECLGQIKSRFAPRPSSLTSDAHRNLTLAVRQRNVKRARITEIVTDFDPESEKAKRIKSKDDLARSRARSGGAARRSGGGGGGGGRRRGMNASYLEDDDDDGYEGVNLGRLKRQTMRGDSDEEEELDYGQDSASSEDEWSKKKTQKRGAAAARAARHEDDDSSEEDGEVVL